MASRFLPRLPALFAFAFCARLCGFASPDAAEASCDIPASELKIRDPFVFADKKSGKYYMHANGGKLSPGSSRASARGGTPCTPTRAKI